MTDELYHLSRKGLRGPAHGPVAHAAIGIGNKRRSGMKKWLIGVGAVLLSSCVGSVALAQKIGDAVRVRAICAEEEMVERAAKAIHRDRRYGGTDAEFAAAVAEGQCYVLPYPVEFKVDDVGYRSPIFVDDDGDQVRISVIRVRGAWTLFIEVLKMAGRS